MKFSVIIPVFNISPYIDDCLHSITEAVQKWLVVLCNKKFEKDVFHHGKPLIEIICVDDGSTDGSGDILDKWETEERSINEVVEIQIIHQENKGVSAARNAALKIATGNYICFVDGDDAVTPEYFVILESIVVSNNPDIIRFSHHDFNRYKKQNQLTNIITTTLDFRSFVGSTIAWNACYKRTVISNLYFEHIPNGEDILFAAEAFMRAKVVIGINAQIYCYRHRQESAVNTVSMRHFLSKCDMCLLLKERIDNPEIKRNLRNHISGELLPMIGRLSNVERVEGWKYFFEILKKCEWGVISRFIADRKSIILSYILLGGEIKIRHLIAMIKSIYI